MALGIKKNDEVVVIAGKDKGTRGRVLKVDRETARVIVEGVNRVKRHTRPSQKDPQGGIIEKEMPIHISNVMLFDAKADKPSRIRMGQNNDGNKVRVTVKSGTVLDS